ncbi:MAG: bifunctional nicotinamidase/pyrazinamidase [Planctomycetaceae bacterium]|nr:MAG: bifunctional nicotinamidase/pyrazinamidase [Planctomycetaceae bacterium]
MKTLLLVDLQNDFLPGGALAVPEGDHVVPIANRLMPHFALVVASKDWHPPDHSSFASQHPGHQPGDSISLDGRDQILWPDHCVQGTRGAEFSDRLDKGAIQAVFLKGTDPRWDSYSALFDDGHRRSTGLIEYLRERGVDEVCVLGLATDYCVRASVLDALREGLRVQVVTDGCRGVNLQPGDDQRALDAMQSAGATLVTSREVSTRPDISW